MLSGSWAKIDPVTNTENKMHLKNICFSGLFYHTILYYLLVTMHNNQCTLFSHLSFSYLQLKDMDHLLLDFELTYSKNIQSLLKYMDKLQLFK